MAPWQVGQVQDKGMLAVAHRVLAMRTGAQMQTFVLKTMGLASRKIGKK